MFKYLMTVSLLLVVSCGSPTARKVNPVDKSKVELYFQKYDLFVEINWVLGPVGNVRKENHLLVIIRNGTGEPTELPAGSELEFYGEMPSMGHAMDSEGYFEPIGTGLYYNSSIRFNMGGEWLNEVRLIDQESSVQDKVTWSESF